MTMESPVCGTRERLQVEVLDQLPEVEAILIGRAVAIFEIRIRAITKIWFFIGTCLIPKRQGKYQTAMPTRPGPCKCYSIISNSTNYNVRKFMSNLHRETFRFPKNFQKMDKIADLGKIPAWVG